MRTSTDPALLANIIRSTDDAIISKDLNSIVTSWNPAAERLFGFSADEMIGKSITQIIPEHLLHEEQEIIQKVVHGESIEHYETQRKRKDGIYVDLSISVSPIRDNSGKIVGASKIARDITERKATEKRLHESERFNRDLLNSLDLNIAVVNPQGVILATNQAWDNFAQSNGASSLSRVSVQSNYFESCATAIAEGDAVARQALRGIQSVLAGETDMFELEYPCDSPTEKRWFLLKALPFQGSNVITLHQNITQRKMAEMQVKNSEERFRSIVTHGSDIIALLNKDLKVVYRSPSVERISGHAIATGELTEPQASRTEFVHSDDQEKYVGTLQKVALHPGRSFPLHFRSQHKSGHYIELEGVATNYLNDESIRAIVLNLHDVTERLSLERQLARNELQLRLLIKHTPAAIAMFDTEMRYIIASERWVEDYKLNNQDIEGKSHYEIFPEISESWKALHQRALRGEELYEEEDPFPRGDGTTDWVRWKLQPWYTETHTIGGVILFTEVITERKTSREKIETLNEELRNRERRFRALVENNEGIIAVVDPGFNVIYRSDTAERITGYSTDERKLRGVLKDVHPEDLKLVKDTLNNVVSLKGKSLQITFRLKHKDGHYLWAESTFTNLVDDPAVDGIIVNLRDVTEKKQAAQALSDMNANLELNVQQRTQELNNVNKELESFSYSVSHDLRAPLRAINGYAKMLEEDYDSIFDNNAKRLLKTVQTNAQQMGKLIDDLLSFSRLGKKELQKTMVNMNDLVALVMDEFPSLYPDTTVKLNPLPNALGDGTLLKQVWVNYISNAFKYSSKNKKSLVEISSTTNDREIIYSVNDNGVGFDKAYADKLFKVFQRLHTHEEFEGTGVGLAMVEKIINKHGGRVWAESELGHGATFYFSLPKK